MHQMQQDIQKVDSSETKVAVIVSKIYDTKYKHKEHQVSSFYDVSW